MTCGGCHLEDSTRNILVGLVTFFASMALVATIYAMIAMWALHKCSGSQTQRLIYQVFAANCLFALVWAFPYHHALTFSTIHIGGTARCILGAIYETSRFLCLLFEIRLIAFVLYCSRFQREAISKWAEGFSASVAASSAIAVGIGFLIHTLVENNDTGPTYEDYNNMSYAFFGLVTVVCILRFVVYLESRYVGKLVKDRETQYASGNTQTSNEKPMNTLPKYLAKIIPGRFANLIVKARTSEDININVLSLIVKPLQYYPVIYLLTLLPQLLIVIIDQTSTSHNTYELWSGILHIFVPWRGFLNFLVYLSDNPEVKNVRYVKSAFKFRWANRKRDADGNWVLYPGLNKEEVLQETSYEFSTYVERRPSSNLKYSLLNNVS